MDFKLLRQPSMSPEVFLLEISGIHDTVTTTKLLPSRLSCFPNNELPRRVVVGLRYMMQSRFRPWAMWDDAAKDFDLKTASVSYMHSQWLTLKAKP